MVNYNSLLGKRIKEFRKRKGLTQAQLAEIVDRSTNHISKIEVGCANPALSLLIDIANALNVTLDKLFYTDDLVSINKLKQIDWSERIAKINDDGEQLKILRLLDLYLDK